MSRKQVSTSPEASAKAGLPTLSETLEQKIDEEIGPLVSQSQRTQIVTRIAHIVTGERFSGPIAHPRHLQEYERVLPGSADRIISMAESAQQHDQQTEKTLVEESLKTNRYAMYLGFIALMSLIAGALYAGLHGNNTLAGFLLTAGVLGGATTLIRGYNQNKQP